MICISICLTHISFLISVTSRGDSIGIIFSFYWGPGDDFLIIYNITLFTISTICLLAHADLVVFLFFQNYIYSCNCVFRNHLFTRELHLVHIHVLMSLCHVTTWPIRQYTLIPFIYTGILLYVSALKEPPPWNTDTFREQGWQNLCPDVNIRLKTSVLCVTWQCRLTTAT